MIEFSFQVDPRQISAVRDSIIRDVLAAATGGVRAATKRLERDLEEATRRAVKGNAWKAWASRVYPDKADASRSPVGRVYVNGNARSRGLISYWTKPGINKAREGFWLAVPLPAAGPRGRNGALTPGEWEVRNGTRLQYVHRNADGYAMLVAEVTRASNGSGVARPLTSRRIAAGRKRETVPIFLLIPFQRHANRVSVDPLIDRAGASLSREIQKRIGAIT